MIPLDLSDQVEGGVGCENTRFAVDGGFHRFSSKSFGRKKSPPQPLPTRVGEGF
jgi:hypothetical protein